MMRMTRCKFMQFLLKVDKRIMKNLSPWWKEREYHGNDNGSGSSWKYRCKGSMAGACKRWWGGPGFRVSHDLATRKRATIWARCKHEHLKHRKHSFSDGRLGVIPSNRSFSKRMGFDSSGSSGSRSFGEVLHDSNVFGVTVVVHGS